MDPINIIQLLEHGCGIAIAIYLVYWLTNHLKTKLDKMECKIEELKNEIREMKEILKEFVKLLQKS